MPRLLLALLLALAAANARAEAGLPHALSVRVGTTAVEVRHGDEDAEAAEQVARVLPEALDAAGRWGCLGASLVISIHPDHRSLEAAAGKPGTPWMRAWAHRDAVEIQSPRTWSRGFASDGVLRQVLAHELTHLRQFQATGFRWQDRQVPLWFQEGMATVTAGERHVRADAAAVESPGRLLGTDARLVYGTADRAFRFLVERHGEAAVRRVLARLGEGKSFPESFRDAVGEPLAEFERDLRVALGALAMRSPAPVSGP